MYWLTDLENWKLYHQSLEQYHLFTLKNPNLCEVIQNLCNQELFKINSTIHVNIKYLNYGNAKSLVQKKKTRQHNFFPNHWNEHLTQVKKVLVTQNTSFPLPFTYQNIFQCHRQHLKQQLYFYKLLHLNLIKLYLY